MVTLLQEYSVFDSGLSLCIETLHVFIWVFYEYCDSQPQPRNMHTWGKFHPVFARVILKLFLMGSFLRPKVS